MERRGGSRRTTARCVKGRGRPGSVTVSPERVQLALGRLRDTQLSRYPHTPLMARIWELRENLTAYDAAYVALAEALDAPLVTMDARLAQAPGVRAVVEVYG